MTLAQTMSLIFHSTLDRKRSNVPIRLRVAEEEEDLKWHEKHERTSMVDRKILADLKRTLVRVRRIMDRAEDEGLAEVEAGCEAVEAQVGVGAQEVPNLGRLLGWARASVVLDSLLSYFALGLFASSLPYLDCTA